MSTRGIFNQDVIFTRLLFRDVVVCNTPESVAEAFVEQHEIFQRKSPQHRHALAPLLGDGLFISDGPLWRERRRVVAPVTHATRLAELAPAITEVAAFADYQRLVDQTDLISLLSSPDWVPRPASRRARAAAGRIHAVVDRLIATSSMAARPRPR